MTLRGGSYFVHYYNTLLAIIYIFLGHMSLQFHFLKLSADDDLGTGQLEAH